jgi:hypothetical protein
MGDNYEMAGSILAIVMVVLAAAVVFAFQRPRKKPTLGPPVLILLLCTPAIGLSYYAGQVVDDYLFGEFDSIQPGEQLVVPIVTVVGTLFGLASVFGLLLVMGYRFRAGPETEHAADYDERNARRPNENAPADTAR